MLGDGLKKKQQDSEPLSVPKTTLLSASAEETKTLAQNFAQILKPGSILALHGELGAGKTTFVKGLIPALCGLQENLIQSPTFNYLNVFEVAPPIYHFDLYRIKNAYAFLEMGFLDYFDGEGICLIEWPERINALLPPHTIHIEIFHVDSKKRQIDVR